MINQTLFGALLAGASLLFSSLAQATQPAIDLEKLVSVDGGATYVDADTSATAPSASAPSGALHYRLTVRNTGADALTGVVITDTMLGLTLTVGNLAIGAQRNYDSKTVPKLKVLNACAYAVEVTNTASVKATGKLSYIMVADSDAAVVKCVAAPPPQVKLKKQISVDYGVTFRDADKVGDADVPTVPFPSGALYRFIVQNTGSVGLINVLVNDPMLGISNYSVGTLAAGQTKTLTQSQIPYLSVPQRCNNAGTFTNVATVSGKSASNNVSVTDSNAAVLVCVGDPKIELKKQISVDGGASFADADQVGNADVPSVAFPSGALYRFIVMNIGTVELQNVVVSDATLGIANFFVGTLPVGAQRVLTRAEIPALQVAQRCAGPGTFTNVAQATGYPAGGGAPVMDSDTAVLACKGVPQIDLKKQISVNGGASFADANQVGNADVPTVPFPSGALYRFVIRNIGNVGLQNVVVNDPVLGIANFAVGSLAPGQERTITSGELPQLNVALRCNSTGTFTNVAQVNGTSMDTGAPVTDSDPAVLICVGVPKIDLKKQISVNGGATFADADSVGAPDVPKVSPPSGALYRFIVQNTGTADLQNVVVNDPALGIVNRAVGNLAVGQTITLTQADIPQLNVAQRCSSSGTFTNVATVSGQSPSTGQTVTDSDAAVLVCELKCAFLVIDEDSIDNGPPPNFFSAADVNDDITEIGVRRPLRFFNNPANFGRQIVLYTGQTGDEGWFAPETIPASWIAAGPTADGLRNFFGNPLAAFPYNVGPGLGTPNGNGDREALLDKIPNVTPLRARGLKILADRQECICAVVYDSDISMNYGPLNGQLKGHNNGVVAFDVLRADKRVAGVDENTSSSSLPKMTVRIRNPNVCEAPLKLFLDAPAPSSSSVPNDIDPNSTADDGGYLN
jgi:uncharacterized repeat protein (TIGR01451 family)